MMICVPFARVQRIVSLLGAQREKEIRARSLFRLLLDLRSSRRQPALRVLVVERPRWHNGEERQRRTREADVDGEFEVSENKADDPGDNLLRGVRLVKEREWVGKTNTGCY